MEKPVRIEKLSRRSFLKGVGFSTLGALSAGALAACSPNAGEASSTAQNGSSGGSGQAVGDEPFFFNSPGVGVAQTPTVTESADVVVVGSGMAGFYAANITKEQKPDTTVVMLEKNSILGGLTTFASMPPTPMMPVAPEDAWKEATAKVAATLGIGNPVLYYEMYLDQDANADWLVGKSGVKLQLMSPDMPVAGFAGSRGDSAIATLAENAEKIGVDIRTNARAVALVTSDTYTVTGVQYLNETGEVIQIDAKATVLASGGLSSAPDLLGKLSFQVMDKTVDLGGINQTGDGQIMVQATAHGRVAHITCDSNCANIGALSEPAAFDSALGCAAAMQYSDLFVNEYGLRFCDESGQGTKSDVQTSKSIEGQGRTYSVFDAAGVKKHEEVGNGRHYSFWTDKYFGGPMPLADDLNRYASYSWFFKADSIEELGQAIAAEVPTFDVEVFKEQIERYNTSAVNGNDSDFGKPTEFIWPVKEGPFYAVQCCSLLFNTSGGINVNRDAQVVDPRGLPISGLYAAGIAISGFDNEVYGGGTCQPVAAWSGSKAARYIVTNVLGGTVAADWMGAVRYQDIEPLPPQV
jgi:fumarate reductase flavoprotein subunit